MKAPQQDVEKAELGKLSLLGSKALVNVKYKDIYIFPDTDAPRDYNFYYNNKYR